MNRGAGEPANLANRRTGELANPRTRESANPRTHEPTNPRTREPANPRTREPADRYTLSTNLTKVAGEHEVRNGFDFVRLRLNHWQPEVGNPRGALTFGGGITGTPGYAGVGGWNGYAAFLLGEMSSYGKSIQFEELSGRASQYGLYVADRWQVNPKFTLNLGLRYEYYPLMTRQDRGIELLGRDTFNIRLGGLGGNLEDLGIYVSKTLFAPRFGAAIASTSGRCSVPAKPGN